MKVSLLGAMFALVLSVTISSVAYADMVTVFGPQKFTRGTQTSSFHGLSQKPEPGKVLITLGGDEVDCGKHPKLSCLAKKALEILHRPAEVKIVLNGQTVYTRHGGPLCEKYAQVSVVINKDDQLKVTVKGSPLAFAIVQVKSKAVVQHPNPVARFSFTPTTGTAPQIFTFNALASSATNATIESYDWNFGDGQTDTGSMVVHNFAVAGTYNVQLKVTDTLGGTATVSHAVVVTTNQLPVASFAMTSHVENTQIIHFDASASHDSDGSIASYAWDFGDGQTGSGVTTDHTYSAGGSYTVSLTVTDDKGGTQTQIQPLTVQANNPPPLAKLTFTEPSSNVAPLMVAFDASGSSSPLGKALRYHFDFGDGETADSDSGLVSHSFNSAGSYTVMLTVTDTSEVSAQTQTTITATDPVLPPPAETQAPALSDTTPQPMVDTVRFLYAGTNPVQTNVQDGAIDPDRVAVLQGTVVDENDHPISGVKITVLEMPQIGQTLTDADGKFHIVANGGGTLTVTYQRNGYFTVQRKLKTTALDYFNAEKVIMLRPDEKVTQVTLGSTDLQMVKGSTVSDQSGARTSVMVLPPGTTASLKMPDGSMKQTKTLSLRMTEYTVGEDGPKRMPADLPATTSYTYAADISADEAIAAGASHVVFSNPVPNYVDNFLNFPVGTAVPYGSYDEQLGAWVAEKDGVVIKVLDVQDDKAVLSMSRDESPATTTQLSQIHVTDLEREKIAQLYSPGKTFWRVQVEHLSAVDYNWLNGNPLANEIPLNSSPRAGNANKCECAIVSTGSIIGVNEQSLGENIAFPGIPTALTYSSLTVPARYSEKKVSISLIGSDLPQGSSITNIHLHIEIAGQIFDKDFVPSSNLSYVWEWDGKDGFGRSLHDSANAKITITYSSQSLYYVGPYIVDLKSFAQPEQNVILSGEYGRAPADFKRSFEVGVGTRQLVNASDVGSWKPNQVHAYDPFGKKLYLGDGSIIDASQVSPIIANIAGNPYSADFLGDGDYAMNARFGRIKSVAIGPDSSIFINDIENSRIRKITPDGIVHTVVGNGEAGDIVEGILGTQSPNYGISAMAVDSNGILYFSDGTSKIHKLTADGRIVRVAGRDESGFSGDGGPALQAELSGIADIEVSSDGTIYFIDSSNFRIRKISPDGTINTVAGNGTSPSSGDEGSALAAGFSGLSDITIGPNKEIYVLDDFQIRLITNDGIIHHYAGTSTRAFSGDGGPASAAQFGLIAGIDVAPDGTLYIADTYTNSRIRTITPDHIVHTVAGTTANPDANTIYYFNAQAAFQGPVYASFIKTYGKDKVLFSSDSGVRSLQPALPALNAEGYSIGSKDGSEIYQFSALGMHLKTLYAKTGKTKWSFGYDSDGRLISMQDGSGNKTTITRDGNGSPTAMTGPFGQTINFTTDANGYLTSITNASGETTSMSYYPGGLLAEFKKPKGNASVFTYNDHGELLKDTDAAGGFKALSQDDPSYVTHTVTQTSAMGKITQLSVDNTYPGITSEHTTYPDGRIVDQYKSNYESGVNDYSGSYYMGYGPDIDPRLGGITQFYVNENISNNEAFSNSLTDVHYTPLSSTDFFKYVQKWSVASDSMTVDTTYNSDQKTTTSVTGMGRTMASVIDDLERPVQVSSGSFAPVQYSYTPQGQLASIQQGTRVMQFAYNSAGQLQSVTNPLGQSEQYEWDASGRLSRTIRADGKQTNYGYDANSNLSSLQPPDKLIHSLTSNIVDLFAVYTPPAVGSATSESYTYNLDRQLMKHTRLDGSSIQYSYDGTTGLMTRAQGSLKSIDYQLGPGGTSYPDHSTTSDNVILGVSHQGDLQFARAYDGLFQGYVLYHYGEKFRLEQIQISQDGSNTNWLDIPMGYDNDSLLTSAGDLQITRDTVNGVMTSNQLGSATEAFTYNQYGEITQDTNKYGSNTLLSETYTRDALGRITTKTENVQGVSTTYTYGYDLAGRLSDVSVNESLQTHYTYDGNGNRLSANAITASYDAQDRLTQYGSTTYTFDANGSLQRKQSSSGTVGYRYDDFGQLAQVTLADGGVVKYLIDGDLNRVEKLINGTITKKFIYHAGHRVAAELNTDNTLKSVFVYGTQSHSPDYMIQGTKRYRFVKDQLGSIRLVVNVANGNVLQRLDYDEFGKVTQDTNPGFQPFGFAGGLYDPDTKLVRFGARDYDADTGRWTSKDPILFAGGDTNLFGYSFNDPINGIDPLGLWTIQIGVSGSLSGFGSSVTGGFGIAVDGQGNITTYKNGAVGIGTGFGVSGGTSVQGSNACSVQDLAGPFATASIGAGEGANVSIDQFGGLGSHNQPVTGVGITLGVGLGAGGSATVGPTYLGPILNPFH